MHIESISFSKNPIDGSGWSINGCSFDKINLIAGKNASGKTRLVNHISVLIEILLDTSKTVSPLYNYKWEIKLKEKDKRYIYQLEIENGNILFEKLLIDNIEYFSRDKDGKGQIKYESRDNLSLEFEIQKSKILLSSKRDKIQHPSLEPIFDWINSVYTFNFGDTLGRQRIYNPDDTTKDTTKDDKAVVYRLKKGLEKLGYELRESIINDFNSIGYNIEDIFIKEIGTVFILYIKERENIIQFDISQGMFRALSLIIQIKYLEYKLDSTATILIDDIGEGLDFDRANNLIKYLIKNIKQYEDKIQLIMTTNDRLVMNNVPLEYWIIVDKNQKGEIEFFSQKTHSKIFNKFKRIGLNNFDFFTSEYYKENFEKDI